MNFRHLLGCDTIEIRSLQFHTRPSYFMVRTADPFSKSLILAIGVLAS